MRPRFLFFLYFLPPAMGTAPARNARIAGAIASRIPGSLALTARLFRATPKPISGLEIRTVRAWDYRAILRRHQPGGYLPEDVKRSPWRQWIIRFINTFPFNVLIGEGGIFYFFKLILEGSRQIRKGHVSHLYSSFRPFTDHFAAYCLKRWHPHIYWIADFRDLVVDPHYRHVFFPRLHQALMKKIFRRADLITTVSDGLAVHLQAYNPNVLAVRNGIAGEIRPAVPVISRKFSVAYTGSMFLDTRDPCPVFRALSKLIAEGLMAREDLRIVYAGKDSATWLRLADRFGLRKQVDAKGIVPPEEAMEIQRTACINLLLTMSSAQLQGALTGKFIEYLAAGSPVLGIVAGRQDQEIADILAITKIGTLFTNAAEDITGIGDVLCQEYDAWKASGMNRKPVDVEVLRTNFSQDATMLPFWNFIGWMPGND